MTDNFKCFDVFDYLLVRPITINSKISTIDKIKKIWSLRCGIKSHEVSLFHVLQRYNDILSYLVDKGLFRMMRVMNIIYKIANEYSTQGLFFENGKNKFGDDIVTNINEALILGYVSFFTASLTKSHFDNIIITDSNIDEINKLKDEVINFDLYTDMKDHIGEFGKNTDITYFNYKNEIFVNMFYERCSRKNYTTDCFYNVIDDVVVKYHHFIKTEMEKELGTFNEFLFGVLTNDIRLTYDNLSENIISLEVLKNRNH